MTTIMILLVIFQIKHFIADYPLQNTFMLGKFKDKGWILPLSAHCGVHAIFTFLISIHFSLRLAIICAIIDFVFHFIMDRIKASSKLLGKYQSISKSEYKSLFDSKALCEDGLKTTHPELVKESQRRLHEIEERFRSNTKFWWSLGLDQGVHHLTHYLIIFLLVM